MYGVVTGFQCVFLCMMYEIDSIWNRDSYSELESTLELMELPKPEFISQTADILPLRCKLGLASLMLC